MLELILEWITIKAVCEIDEVFSDWFEEKNEVLLGRVESKPAKRLHFQQLELISASAEDYIAYICLHVSVGL